MKKMPAKKSTTPRKAAAKPKSHPLGRESGFDPRQILDPQGRETETPGKASSVPIPVAPAEGYVSLLTAIKERVAKAQVRAHAAVCRELNLLYWQIGRDIVERQKREGWGRSVIEKLAVDIQAAFPGIEGSSANNIWRMRAFYLAFEAESPILAQPAQEIRAGQPSPILAQPATELPPSEIRSIPWFHNVILIQKVKDPARRITAVFVPPICS